VSANDIADRLKGLDDIYLYIKELRRINSLVGGPLETEDVPEPLKGLPGKPAKDRQMYTGNVNVVVKSPVNRYRVRKLIEHLMDFSAISPVWEYWSVGKGFEILISLKEPAPVWDILEESPLVESIYEHGKEIQVKLVAEQGPPY
jgi:hypothetical protein